MTFQTTDPAGGPIRGNADELLTEMTEHANTWDYTTQPLNLKGHPLLLVAATHDTPDEGVDQHAKLAQAIRAAGGKDVRVMKFDDDHPFSAHRVALANVLMKWLREDCFRAQPAPLPRAQSRLTLRRRPNQAMQRTAGRAAFTLPRTSTFNPQPHAPTPAVADLVSR